MVDLRKCGVDVISHHCPLHYFPFIARSGSLKSKPALREEGFDENHFRSLSKRSDVERGFGGYVFLTLTLQPRIVQAKLRGGFPHITVLVPASTFDDVEFDLCRYNVAMTRRLRRGDKEGFRESPTNGRYYGEMQIPIARTIEEKTRLLEQHYPNGTMIEVLVDGELPLPDDTRIVCYHEADLEILRQAGEHLNCAWHNDLQEPPGEYNRRQAYVDQIECFIETALADPNWRGNGLEFDNVR